METVVKFTDNKEEVLDEYVNNRGLIHTGEKNLTDGDFLVFIELEDYINEIRISRDKALRESDHYMLTDVKESLSTNEYEAMKTYRQSLRNLPENINSKDVEWPSKPSISIVAISQ